MIIHDHSMDYPNSGSLEVALTRYYKRLQRIKKYDRPLSLISVVVDIAYRNPRTYAISSAILSKLLSFLETECEKRKVVENIWKKFGQIPNTGQMDLWLQRISRSFAFDTEFDEPLCKLVRQESVDIWNNDWLAFQDLIGAMDSYKIVQWTKLDEMPPVVSDDEVNLFKSSY